MDFYMKANNIKSFVAGLVTGLMVIIIFTSAAFGQDNENPAPTVTPTPIPTPTPVISPPAPAPPTDMPNLNDNPPELPDIPPAPPLDTPDYSNVPRPLPAPDRVGVDLSDQTPLSMEDAIRLALENNNDIEISQTDVRSAEFDLTIARGVYDPKIVGETFYQTKHDTDGFDS